MRFSDIFETRVALMNTKKLQWEGTWQIEKQYICTKYRLEVL